MVVMALGQTFENNKGDILICENTEQYPTL